MVGKVFLLLCICLLLILKLHLSNVSLLVNEIHCDIVEYLNLLFNANNLDSRNIFKQVICFHHIFKPGIDCSSN